MTQTIARAYHAHAHKALASQIALDYEARFLRSDKDGDGHLTEAEMIPPDR